MGNLQTEELTRSFGKNRVLDGMTFSVEDGKVAGVIGPNGCGKTTFVNVVSGVYKPGGGTVRLNGHQVGGRSMDKLAALGLSRTFQIPKLFNRMTVRENLRVPLAARRMVDDGRIDEILETLLLTRLRDQPAATLSGGQKKLLELARLSMADPSVALLDEPYAGVHPNLKKMISRLVRDMADRGTGVIIVDHDLSWLFGVVDDVSLFNKGSVMLRGTPEEVAASPEAAAVYFGVSTPPTQSPDSSEGN